MTRPIAREIGSDFLCPQTLFNKFGTFVTQKWCILMISINFRILLSRKRECSIHHLSSDCSGTHSSNVMQASYDTIATVLKLPRDHVQRNDAPWAMTGIIGSLNSLTEGNLDVIRISLTLRLLSRCVKAYI